MGNAYDWYRRRLRRDREPGVTFDQQGQVVNGGQLNADQIINADQVINANRVIMIGALPWLSKPERETRTGSAPPRPPRRQREADETQSHTLSGEHSLLEGIIAAVVLVLFFGGLTTAVWFFETRPDEPHSRKASSVSISDDRPSRSRKECYPGGLCITGDLLTYKVLAGKPLKSTFQSGVYTGYSGTMHVVPGKACAGKLTYHITSDGVTRAGPGSLAYTKDDTKTLTVSDGNTTVLNLHGDLASQAAEFHLLVEGELSEGCMVSLTLQDLKLTK
ncbi:hypothetical protein [Streptomyces spiralis]|uniref:hypothetical protein n=1 Tax=Streptomyces spiralis TaxID=66376 RepID=UPI0033D8AA85